MTDAACEIEGFEKTTSDGESSCTGCWDEDHYPFFDHSIPKDEPVYWVCVSTMYGQYYGYCQKCVETY